MTLENWTSNTHYDFSVTELYMHQTLNRTSITIMSQFFEFAPSALVQENFGGDKMSEEKSSKEEQVGFHKGSLTTLAKERQELARMIGVVEQLMQMHIKALKDLGVDLEAEAKKAAESKKKPLEDELR